MKSHFRKKADKVFHRILFWCPSLFFLKTRFTMTYGAQLKGHTQNGFGFVFEQNKLVYQTSLRSSADKNMSVSTIEKQSVKNEYAHFLKLLKDADFIGGDDSNMFDHEGVVKVNGVYTYKLEFLWISSGKLFTYVEKNSDEFYGLDYNDRERFAVFEAYAKSLI